MAKKKCGICGKELDFWDGKYPVKDGVICYTCLFNKGNFYDGAAQRSMNAFLNSHTAAEVKELIDNPKKLQAVKRKVASHHGKPIAQCEYCHQDIYKNDAPLKFKDSTYICLNCKTKHNAIKAHNWASEHTFEDFKKIVKNHKNFDYIYLKKQQQILKELANTKKLIEDVERIKTNNVFDKYITEIYFPYYKNFKEFSKIHFDFPLTVLVGKNGSGKSSVLHALYGCPKGHNIGDFWFSTATDPIKQTKNQYNCFVYSYYEKKEKELSEHQVVYKRSPRPGTKTKTKNLDYWETDRHLPKYKTKSTNERRSVIEENLIYLDFRQELSAYDRYFYFGKEIIKKQTKKVERKQDYIRNKSKYLNNLFTTDPTHIYEAGTKLVPQNEEVINLSDEELWYISYILGVNYTKGKMVSHKFFQIKGFSALVTKNNISYSEANAGSGEYAVINLVHQLVNISDKESTLVILDEPETSLYPGAQKRLLDFLLKMIIIKKCQIVLSTHSEKFIENLPPSAIKAIHFDSDDGKSYIQEDCLPSNVFEEFDIPYEKFHIIVEDKAAALLINKIIEKEKINSLNAQTLLRGAEGLQQISILTSSQEDINNKFYILDGDKKIDKEQLDLDKLSSEKKEDAKYIQSLVDSICPNISFPSGQARSSEKNLNSHNEQYFDEIKYNAEIKYIKFYKNNVYFLPGADPESIIYDHEFIENYLQILPDHGKNINIDDFKTKKDLYYQIAVKGTGETPDLNKDYYTFLVNAIDYYIENDNNSDYYKDIVTILKEIDKKCQSNN